MSVTPILPLSLAVARRCASLREDLAGRARRVRARAFDLEIAAMAVEHGLSLVICNVDDVGDIPDLSLYRFS